MDLETCPICWRAFSPTVVPICLVCGHSCCSDCLASIRSCSLCRHKIAPSFPRKPNYSLMAMIDKLSTTRLLHNSQTTQTDLLQVVTQRPASRRSTQPATPFLEGKAMTVAFKKSAIEFRIK